MVKKLKDRSPSPHKRGVIRQAQCGACGWIVAAPHLGALIGAGWATAFEAGKWAFICRTCSREHPRRLAHLDEAEQVFRQLPAAPPDPFPLIGGKGEKHADTSRPIDVDVKALVVDKRAG